MKIAIWYQTIPQPWGGSHQFLLALAKELTRLGYSISSYPDRKTEVVLINAHNRGPGLYLFPNQVAQVRQTGRFSWYGKWLPAKLWSFCPRRGAALVHRLDGIPELYRGVRTKADELQHGINRLADFTIFQSAFCKESFAQRGVTPQSCRIVYNGVDPSFFYPPTQTHLSHTSFRLVAVSWSSNPRKGFTVLAQLSQIPGIEIRFAGHWLSTVDPGRVILLGPRNPAEIAEALRQSDAMIHAAENEPCSNAIVEALACGLPILYRDSGGNRELAGDYGVPLTNTPSGDIEQLRSRHQELRQRILADRPRFLITDIAQQYLKVFQQAIELRRQ